MAVVMGRRSRVARGTLADSGAAAAAHTFTLPTSATPTSQAADGVADGVAARVAGRSRARGDPRTGPFGTFDPLHFCPPRL